MSGRLFQNFVAFSECLNFTVMGKKLKFSAQENDFCSQWDQSQKIPFEIKQPLAKSLELYVPSTNLLL